MNEHIHRKNNQALTMSSQNMHDITVYLRKKYNETCQELLNRYRLNKKTLFSTLKLLKFRNHQKIHSSNNVIILK